MWRENFAFPNMGAALNDFFDAHYIFIAWERHPWRTLFYLFLGVHYFQRKSRRKYDFVLFFFICNLLHPSGVRNLFFEKKNMSKASIAFVFARVCKKENYWRCNLRAPMVFFTPAHDPYIPNHQMSNSSLCTVRPTIHVLLLLICDLLTEALFSMHFH